MSLLACDFCTSYIDTDNEPYLESLGDIYCERCAEHCTMCNALCVDGVCPDCLPRYTCEQQFHFAGECTCHTHELLPSEPDVGINQPTIERI